MLLAGVFMGFILSVTDCVTGVNGEATNICALKRSSVDLPCSPQRLSASRTWYTVQRNGHKYVQNELSADEARVMYNMSQEGPPTLRITDLKRSDAKFYCCDQNAERPERCWENAIQLVVSDLQVKVIPSTEGQTVTLMCSTSCPLTENPAAYIWYKNGEFVYEDWSPWYQELVSSEEAVRYSCAVKGYEDLRAPQVSVDSVTATCFSVTYAKGRMCSYHHTNVTEACSTTYPKELEVQRSPGSPVGLKCATSCPEIDLKTSYSWYENRVLHRRSDKQQYSPSRSSDKSVYCAVKGLEDLLSPEVCAGEKKCWAVNYASRRICALEGSSVNITSQYSHPGRRQTLSTSWYKIKRGGEQEEAEQLNEAPERVEHHDDGSQRILRIKHLRREDSAAYVFAALQTRDRGRKLLDFPRVTLVVTGLSVWVRPAEVTEGQRVTLTCSTSCPLSANTTYTWKLNSEPLTLPLSQHKHLVLDPVSIQHAGSYSCAVRIDETTMASSEKIVTVQRVTETFAAAAGVGAAFLIITPLVVFFWIRRKRTSGQSLTTEATDNTEQLNQGPLYGNLSAQPTEQDDLHYSSVHFSKSQTAPLYATVEPHQPKEDEQVTYAAVSFRPNVTPE